MSLLYKPDWEETTQRYQAWWRGEYFGRCALWVSAPREGAGKLTPPARPADPIAKWTDLDYLAARNEYEHASTYYGGEAFPIWTGGYPGHTAIPAFLGCPTTLDEVTGWWDPVFAEDDPYWDVASLHIDPDQHWWQFALDLLSTADAASEGKSIPSIGAFGGCGDTLAALRGSVPLLLDCIERPERIAAAERYLMDMWCDVYDLFAGLIRQRERGAACWFGLWAPGRFYASQCDFSYNISPRLFRELFLPAIEQQTRFLKYSVYHLDGTGAFVHLPALLELPGLQAIQVLPGAGKPSPLHYLHILREVQARGKNLHISISPDQVRNALSLLSARGLFLETWCQTESEARALLEAVETWSRP